VNHVYNLLMAVRLFEGTAHAASYAAFRPAYPPSLLEAISTFITAHSGSGYDTAVDVGCGSGQSTFFLTRLFRRVVGVDISKAQVENAQAKCRERQIPEGKEVEFRVGGCDSLPAGPSSVDLVSCGQAWHWLEAQELYREAARVLKPRGTLAVYGYGNVVLANPECNRLVTDFYNNLRRGGYWHEKREHIDNKYQAVSLSEPFHVSERRDLEMSCQMSLSHFTGYVSTWSGYCKFEEKHPNSTALHDLQEGLRAVLKPHNLQQSNENDGEDPGLDMSFPLFLILGQKSELYKIV
jgi:SAM-dependent methyltransferase